MQIGPCASTVEPRQANMNHTDIVLAGNHVRLKPLSHRHIEGLAAAAAADPAFYRWSPVPQGRDEAAKYVDTARAWQDAGTAVPFATLRADDGRVIGSTRFWNIERWAWPPGHSRCGRSGPDACEIGYTWLTSAAIRTAPNSEAKLLMLRTPSRFGRCCASAFTRMRATNARAPQSSASARSSKASCGRIALPRTRVLAIPPVIRSSLLNGRK